MSGRVGALALSCPDDVVVIAMAGYCWMSETWSELASAEPSMF